jgi:hypothetical protein
MLVDADEDEVDFEYVFYMCSPAMSNYFDRNGHSSLAPPEDIRSPSPETHNPPIDPASTSPSFCASVVVD